MIVFYMCWYRKATYRPRGVVTLFRTLSYTMPSTYDTQTRPTTPSHHVRITDLDIQSLLNNDLDIVIRKNMTSPVAPRAIDPA